MKSIIEKRRFNRLHLLYETYKKSTTQKIDIYSVGSLIGLKNGIFEDAYQYLKGEQYVTEIGNPVRALITHAGIKAIEFCILHPESETEHFPPFSELGINE